MSAIPNLPCGLYRHYKGEMYLLLAVGQETETDQLYAVYVALYLAPGPRVRLRPLESFTDSVVYHGIEQPRFAYVAPNGSPA